MTLTFLRAAEAGADCSKSGESFVVDDESATTATLATALTRLARTTLSTTTATTTTATGSLLEVVIKRGLETEKVGVDVGSDSVELSGTELVVSSEHALLVAFSGKDLVLDLLSLSQVLLGGKKSG